MLCGLDKQKKLLEVASTVFSRHRKLLRHQLGHLSHFLHLVEGVNATSHQLQQAVDDSSARSAEQAATELNNQEQLSQLVARQEQLQVVQTEHESIAKHAEARISQLKVTLCCCAPMNGPRELHDECSSLGNAGKSSRRH